ncbi:hypothetical protein EAI_10819, partial [Harpegnathos saltator]
GRIKNLIYCRHSIIDDNILRMINKAIRPLGADEILQETNSFQSRADACVVQNGAQFGH